MLISFITTCLSSFEKSLFSFSNCCSLLPSLKIKFAKLKSPHMEDRNGHQARRPHIRSYHTAYTTWFSVLWNLGCAMFCLHFVISWFLLFELFWIRDPLLSCFFSLLFKCVITVMSVISSVNDKRKMEKKTETHQNSIWHRVSLRKKVSE